MIQFFSILFLHFKLARYQLSINIFSKKNHTNKENENIKGLNINNRLRSPDLVSINGLMSIKYKLKLLVLAIYSITINKQFFSDTKTNFNKCLQ